MSLHGMLAGDVSVWPQSSTMVCGLGGTRGSADVARIAGEIATAIDAQIELVHVLEDGPWPDAHPSAQAARLEGQAMLDGLRDACGPAAMKAHLIDFGDPGYWIASIARTAGARLILIGGSSERKGSAVIGPAATRLTVAAPCPVLVVPSVLEPHTHPKRWHGRTFVCGVDASPEAFNAAVHTGRLAGLFGGTLMLIAVGSGAPAMEPLMQRVVATLSQTGSSPPRVECEVLAGDPAWELECAARALTAPVVAIGSHGLGSDEPVLGSVAWRLLVTAKRSVLVVPANMTAVS
jgi:nucleotide-binding universal stress UspA family protein